MTDETETPEQRAARPLVILEIDGGIVQWTRALPGAGVPRVILLDFDREGSDADDWTDHAAALRDAADAISAYPDCGAYAAGYREEADAADRMAAELTDEETDA